MKKLILPLFSLLFILASCSSNDDAIISGQIEGAENLSVYFDQVHPDGTNNSLTQVPADNKGNFSIQMEEPLDEGVYRIRIGAKSAYIIHLPNDPGIVINGKIDELKSFNYQLEGSSLSESYRTWMHDIKNNSKTINDLKNAINGDLHPLVSMQLANALLKNNPSHADAQKAINDKLRAQYPDAIFTRRHTKLYEGIENTIAAMQRRQGKFKVGDVAPEISLPDPNGKVRKLSDLRGEVVLLDFWASWCGPCRKENPNVVKTYKKYKDKGFNIYSVSLDGIHPRRLASYKTQSEIDKQTKKSKDRWVGAIAKDNLTWDSHVSELKHWNSNVTKLYGVSSIPQTFLINRDGTIAAINPRFNLEEEIKKIL